jgi:GNAT superfamily N-acetyltransferase
MTGGAVRGTYADTPIARATSRDVDALMRVIYPAFFNIAPCKWLFPDPGVREVRLPALLRAQVEHALEHGIVYTTVDLTAAALWHIHHGGPHQSDPAYAARIVEAVGPDHAERIRTFEACTEKVRPAEPHNYLFIAAVGPDWQRRGIGSALLSGCHRELASTGRPTYLEASDPGTRRFYVEQDYVDASGPGIVLPGPDETGLYPMDRPWIPILDQRVTVREEVDHWSGANGRVSSLSPPATARPVHVLIDGEDDPCDFAPGELRPERPREPAPQQPPDLRTSALRQETAACHLAEARPGTNAPPGP